MAGLDAIPMPAGQATRLDEIRGRFDPWLLGLAAVMAGFGVIMVASSSIAIAEGLNVGPFHFLVRHAFFLGLGAVLGLMLARTELKTLEKHSQWMLLGCFVLLLAVFLPGVGHTVNGARRWINLGVSNFQAVEAVKLLLIVWLASYLVRYRDEIGNSWAALLKPLGMAGLLVCFLLVQPDFGSAALILAVTGGMVWLGGARLAHLAVMAGLALPALAAIAIAEPYRVRRLVSFQDPWADPFNDGFQLTQALIAIGRGEWFGVGLGGSVQKLFYLPEAHTDFIFSVTAEELGFAGAAGLILLFAAFAGRSLHVGLRAFEMRRWFSAYCAFGIALWIGLQSFVSIGVNLGLLPTKGLTLPLISSGGSSVLMTCAAIGLLLRVSYELDRAERQVARVRETAPSGGPVASPPALRPEPVVAVPVPQRGQRIEPKLGVL